jgi:hypothetical protein
MEKFETEIIEPEERKPEYNPLDEAVNEKAYTTPNVNTSNVNLNIPIEEPRFAPPPIDTKNNVKGDSKHPKPDPINPEMRNLGKKDTEVAASHMAKLILQGYEWMHDLANKGLKVSERRLNKLQADGEINLNAMIDYDYGKNIRAGDFFIEYNQQIENVLQVSPEFKEEVTPILEKVLAKRGVGMTDEQMLMFMFGKDIAAKSMIFFQQKAQMNLMIATIKEATTNQYAQAAPAAPPPPPPQQQQQQPKPQEPTTKNTTTPAAAHKAEVIAVEPEEYELEPKRQRGRPKK